MGLTCRGIARGAAGVAALWAGAARADDAATAAASDHAVAVARDVARVVGRVLADPEAPVFHAEEQRGWNAPVQLMMQPAEPSVYAPPTPPSEAEGVNMGGVHLDVKIGYFSDHLYRGVDRASFIGDVTRRDPSQRANLQFDGRLEFDLGKLPHPFVQLFTNVLDSDPISNFQELRITYGAEWKVRPIVLAAGSTVYIFPDRENPNEDNELNTTEVWGRLTLDDAVILRRDEPLLSPYVYAAYDFDQYHGWYLEAGVSHDFAIEKTGLVITALANVGYVLGNEAFAGPRGDDTGFQHYEVGVRARYSLNTVLNIPQRYGQWAVTGYLFYTDGLEDDVRADTQLWGGAGFQFQY